MLDTQGGSIGSVNQYRVCHHVYRVCRSISIGYVIMFIGYVTHARAHAHIDTHCNLSQILLEEF
jgi:hypothetical protein